jgi:CheY-like chemotaxis protein
VAGTPDYIAPEVVRDPLEADSRADLYSLGCTLYRFLAGQVPFPGGTPREKMTRHLNEDPTPLRTLRPEVPEHLAEIVARMMAREPARRYQTAAEVAQALAPFASGPAAHVLVVEDPASRDGLAPALEAKGYVVDRARNGLEALDLLRCGLRPRIILVDPGMPARDGWQLLQQRERNPALAAIPVVVVSAADPAQARAAALGAVEFLQQPPISAASSPAPPEH